MIINYQTGMRIIVARSDEHPNILLLGVASLAPGESAMSESFHFVSAGLVERVAPRRSIAQRRGRKATYVWKQGYSLNGNTMPWLTRSEARLFAAANGVHATFCR